jgi:putative ABC transport system permease protein
LGSNLLTVAPGQLRGVGSSVSSGRGSGSTLTQADSDAIAANVSEIAAVSPELSRRYQVVAKSSNTNTNVTGSEPAYLQVHNVDMQEGSFFADSQVQNYSKVAVLGPTTRDDLFGQDATGVVGQSVNINGIPFTVIGITQSKGGTGFNNPDDAVYIPLTTAQRFLAGNASLSDIAVAAQSQNVMTDVQSQITALLLQRHNISDPAAADFSVINQADIVSAASNVTSVFTMLLASVAGISLVVGGIGIMNMMLTTVTERTREIGLRKAIGAKPADIVLQFLVEAVLLTFLGGVAGVALGWLASMAIAHFASITTTVSASSILLAFGVSAAIGILFGYYPARRAASLNPIEALRYE